MSKPTRSLKIAVSFGDPYGYGTKDDHSQREMKVETRHDADFSEVYDTFDGSCGGQYAQAVAKMINSAILEVRLKDMENFAAAKEADKRKKMKDEIRKEMEVELREKLTKELQTSTDPVY